MRVILFRGKNFAGEWEYGVPVFSGLNNELAFMKQMYSYDHQVIPETVGQFTGMTDKNGKKIFEGDIVQFDNGVFCVQFYECRMGFAFSGLFGRGCVPGFGMTNWENIEIIGNIHDNPELLKEE